jgi:hypothetical protein
MGKKNKNKGSFDGDNAYDYLSRKFDKNYRPHMAERESSEVYNRKRDQDFQRYLMTGEKSSGRGKHVDDITGFNDKKDKTAEGRLFAAGIPPSQWKYYAQKAGITNVNSKSDAKKLISVYNEDERYQGPDRESTPAPSQAAQDFKDEYVDKVIENTVPEPEFVPQQSIGDVTGGDNSIVSPINQDNDININGNNNSVDQNNSIKQMMNNMKQSLRFAY